MIKTFRFNLANVGTWLTLLVVVWFLGVVGLGWLVKSFLFLFGLLLVTPALVFLGVRWWLQRNLVQAQCPICQHESAGLNRTQIQCPNCGEPLKVEQGHFNRLTPPGTIDVQAVEVPARAVKD